MADKSLIEWTDATWNPVRGCSRVSAGCGGPNHQGGCYAEKIAARFSLPGQPFHGFAERTEHGGRWTGKLALIPQMLTLPLHWRKPRRIFVNSMSDLFHEHLPDDAIDQVFAVMALCPQHTFQVLTKRPARMREYILRRASMTPEHATWFRVFLLRAGMKFSKPPVMPLPNVWLGTSVEDQKTADERIPVLLATPAAKRFLSCEPLLGPIDLRNIKRHPDLELCAAGKPPSRVDWVIAGGESGPNARPMHPDWARSLRDQCQAAGVPFFFKQWGEWAPRPSYDEAPIGTVSKHSFGTARVGKKAAGAMLDGREWREMPHA